MNTLPELRKALIDAGYRLADVPEGQPAAGRRARRRRVGHWLRRGPGAAAVTLALVSAAAVVVVALSTVRSPTPGGHLPAPAGQGGTPSPAPPQQPSLSAAAARDITQASRSTIAHDRACSASAPATFPIGHAPASLTRNLSVLRRSATPADRLPSWLVDGDPRVRRNLYLADSRLAATVDGARFYIIPSANVMGWRPVPSRCDQEQREALARHLAQAAPQTRRRILDQQRRYLAWKRYVQQHPDGVTLSTVVLHPSPGSAATFSGGSGFTFADIRQGRAGVGDTETRNGTVVFHQLVPDGVARVTVRFTGHAPETVPVTGNLYAVRVPGAGVSGAVPAAITWLSATGKTIRPLR